MALNFPWEMYLQAAKQKQENKENLFDTIGQFGQTIGDVSTQINQSRAKKGLQNLLAKSSQPTPAGVAGTATGGVVPNLAQQAMPYMMKIDPQGVIQGLMAQNDPYKQSEIAKNNAMTALYKGRTNVLGKPGEMTTVYQNPETGEVSTEPKEGWVSYQVKPATALQYTGMPKSKTGNIISWDAATPQQKSMAKNFYDGNIRSADLGVHERTVIVGLANEYADKNHLPPMQSYSGAVKGKMAESLSSGKLGMNALSLNTALGHAGSALQAYQGVANTDKRWLNQPINAIRSQSNDPNIIKLQTSLNALGGELATVFKGSAGTDQEIGHWMQVLSQDLTPQQAMGAIQEVNGLLRHRLNALQYQQQNVMGGRPGDRQLLSPDAAKLSKTFATMGNNKGPKAGMVEDGYRFKGGNPKDPSAWEKI